MSHKYSDVSDIINTSERDWALCCLFAETHNDAVGSISGTVNDFQLKCSSIPYSCPFRFVEEGRYGRRRV